MSRSHENLMWESIKEISAALNAFVVVFGSGFDFHLLFHRLKGVSNRTAYDAFIVGI